MPQSFRNIISALCFLTAIGLGLYQHHEPLVDNPIGISHYGSKLVNWESRRQQVKQAFVTSWDAYTQHAWGG
jgi:mannosyl-oligosaccharide alpha-1,2-mannosidase